MNTAASIKACTAPSEIGYAQDENRLKLQGEDAFGADPDGLVLSRWWKLSVDGMEIPVFAAPITRGGPLSFAVCEFAGDPGTVTLTAQSAKEVCSAAVRPVSYGIEPEVNGQEIRIRIDGACKLIVETNDSIDHPLFIAVHGPERDVPAADDPNVRYFGPGLHLVDKLRLDAGQTLYAAAGAVVRVILPEAERPIIESDWAKQRVYEDTITAYGVGDITIRGRGIIDLSMLPWHARKAIFIQDCRNVRIQDLTFVGTAHWTIHLSESRDCWLEHLTLIGYRENSDGIDIVNCERVKVADCLIRTGDDAVVVKAMAEPPVIGGRDIEVSRCVIWNDKVRCLGITGETRTDISDVLFHDCDIVHSFPTWTEEIGSLCIVVSDSGTIERIRFENIRIEEERQYALVCLVFKDRWSVDQAAGRIRDIVFSNIRMPAGVPSLFHGYDDDHLVENIRIENLQIQGAIAMDADRAGFRTNAFARGIRFE